MLVSEVMLQQTQVSRVVPIWHAFLERFPTVAACADASQADVVTGVGRARLQPSGGQPPPRRGCHGTTRCRAISTPCWRCPASAPTPREPCSCSRSRRTSGSSTRTSRGCCRGARAGGSRRRSCRRGRRARARGRGVGVEPGLMDLGALVCTRARPVVRSVLAPRRLSVGRASTGRRRRQSTFAGSIARAVDAWSPRSAPETVPIERARCRDGLARRSPPRGARRRAARRRGHGRDHVRR